jgi:hypothetical protein
MTRHIVAAALALVVLAVTAGAASAQTPEKRVALVIGNDAYQTLPRLGNATADARDIGKALEGTGFDTTLKTDVKRRELYQLIDAFAARIAGSPDTVGLFYYAGHGIQTNGKNYLVPVDAALTSDADLEAEAVDAGKVLSAMDQARNRINIVILDACRDNPLPKGRSLARGLTSMPAPRGTFIGYAAAPGQTAQDGEPGENGVFTGTLIKQLGVPGLQLEEVFKRVIGGVSERTGGKQLPWMESSVQGNFYFLGPTSVNVTPPPTPPSPPPTDAEMVFWQSIPGNAAASDYEEYLRQFPQGRFAGLARNRLAALRSPQGAAKADVDPILIGTFSHQSVIDDYDWRFIYTIAPDGTYRLVTTQEENGTYQAANGKYRTIGAKTNRVRAGTYHAVSSTAIEVRSATGAVIFRPLQPSTPVDQAHPVMLGLWHATFVQGGMTWMLTIQNNPDGTYRYQARTEDRGVCAFAERQWRVTSEVTGQSKIGAYRVVDARNVEISSPDGSAIWQRQ